MADGFLTATFDGLCAGRLGQLRKPFAAAKILETYEESGGEVNVIHYNAAISACATEAQWSLALHLFTKAQWLKLLDVVSYGALIHVFSKANKVEEAQNLLQSALKQKLQVNSIIFSSCITGQTWTTALELILQMQQGNLEVTPALNSAISCCRTVWPRTLGLLRWAPTSSMASNAVLTAIPWMQSLEMVESMASKSASADLKFTTF